MTVLIRSVVRALHLQCAPQRKSEFIAELRQAQTDIAAFMGRSGSDLSPACRRLPFRLRTALEARLIALSMHTQRQLSHDQLVVQRAAEASAKARPP